jgi:hypothetical protein
MFFEDVLEQEMERVSENDALSFDDAYKYLQSIQEEEKWTDEDVDAIMESLKKRVSSDGSVKKVRDKKTRSKKATRTTGMSKGELKRRGKKSAKTRSHQSQTKSKRKRKKTNRIRRRMGLS